MRARDQNRYPTAPVLFIFAAVVVVIGVSLLIVLVAVVAVDVVIAPQSRFGDKLLKIRVVCPQNGTAVLQGLRTTACTTVLFFLCTRICFLFHPSSIQTFHTWDTSYPPFVLYRCFREHRLLMYTGNLRADLL